MDEVTAIAIARSWTAWRKEVRAILIARARNDNPVNAPTSRMGSDWPNNDVRKLWQFPPDLSEGRLLKLIDDEKPEDARHVQLTSLLEYVDRALTQLPDDRLAWLARHPEEFDELLDRI
jgi:hypothetical protein